MNKVVIEINGERYRLVKALEPRDCASCELPDEFCFGFVCSSLVACNCRFVKEDSADAVVIEYSGVRHRMVEDTELGACSRCSINGILCDESMLCNIASGGLYRYELEK